MNKLNREISHSEDGFTLIEVLVVVIIVGILASIAAPGWLGFLERQRTNSVKSDLLSTLREAQEDSKQKSTGRTVTFRDTLDGPVVDITSGSGGVVTQLLGSDSKSVKLRSFIGGHSDPTMNVTADNFRFDERGGVDTVPFIIQIGTDDDQAQRCLIISTLLGGISEASGDECDNPNPEP